jgi:hypothetical protein
MRIRRGSATASAADRFADEYRGEDAPEDALWWLDHPTAPGPSGALSREQRMAPLRAAVYGRAPTEADRAALREAEAADAAATALAAAVRDRVAASSPARTPVARRRIMITAVIAVTAFGSIAVLSATGGRVIPAPRASLTVGPYIDTGRTNAPLDDSGATIVLGTLVDPVRNRPAAFAGAASTVEFTGDGVAQIDLPSLKGVKRVAVAVTCDAPDTYTWLVTGPSPSRLTGNALAVSDVRACTGSPSILSRPLDVAEGTPSIMQVSGGVFDAVVAEFR